MTPPRAAVFLATVVVEFFVKRYVSLEQRSLRRATQAGDGQTGCAAA